MHKLTQRGFTLIELLVVIAIIGILASVVLASLNSARDKGADATIKSSINNARAQAELFYDDNGGYANLCANDTINNIEASVDDANGSATVYCNSTADAYVLASPLVSTSTTYCVDSTGVAQEGAAATTGTACP